MPGKPISIVWFRQDLRVDDNPALAHAAERGDVLPVYILDEAGAEGRRPIGSASLWWLHHSLEALSKSLGGLALLRGNPAVIIPDLCRRIDAAGVYWNRCYEPFAIERDKSLKAALKRDGIDVASFNASLLFEPWQVHTKDGGPYKVYSPFWRTCRRLPVAAPQSTPPIAVRIPKGIGDRLTDWGLLPTKPNWAAGFELEWTPGERGASDRLERFLDNGLSGYGKLRDRPDLENVSKLSPHLHWGEISPRRIWATIHMRQEMTPKLRNDGDKFLSELGWREFSYHLLYHFPTIPEQNWKSEFDSYPWSHDKRALSAWKKGQTGYPLVDAGMRELWTTGYMHNRVRMVVASFLTKHLRIDWREGEAWFWDTLVDADLANNVAGWQWVAGSGADAAPYFRIFNPTAQAQKFDPDGAYIRRWCPELAKLSDSAMHAPFEATAKDLKAAGIELGVTYPVPIVDHAEARQAAMEGYKQMGKGT